MKSIDQQILLVVCLLTGEDYELLRNASSLDKSTVVFKAIALVLSGIFATAAWTLFGQTIWPLHAALPTGVLIGAIVFVLDRTLGASDWSLKGVLAEQRVPISTWFQWGLRAAIALSLAIATANGVLLALFADAIDEEARRVSSAANHSVREEYAGLKRAARALHVGPLESEIKSIEAERERLQQAMAERERAVVDARRKAAEARLEAAREQQGGLPGYQRGRGPRWAEARRLEAEADRALAQATTDNAQMQARLDALLPALAAKGAALREAGPTLRAEEMRIDAQMRSDPRWAHRTTGPLGRWMALDSLRSDPRHGPVVTRFEWTIKVVLIAFELSFLFCTIYAPASVYRVRLIRRTREQALKEACEYRNYLWRMQLGEAPPPALPSFRVSSAHDADPSLGGNR